MITMLLGGLWHGAGWSFVLWGALHGVYLMINHGWLNFRKKVHFKINKIIYNYLAWQATFIAVVVGWVLFRAETLRGATLLLKAMVLPMDFKSEFLTGKFWFGGESLTRTLEEVGWLEIETGTLVFSPFMVAGILIILSLVTCLVLKSSTDQIAKSDSLSCLGRAVLIGLAGFLSLFSIISNSFTGDESPFLYYQF